MSNMLASHNKRENSKGRPNSCNKDKLNSLFGKIVGIGKESNSGHKSRNSGTGTLQQKSHSRKEMNHHTSSNNQLVYPKSSKPSYNSYRKSTSKGSKGITSNYKDMNTAGYSRINMLHNNNLVNNSSLKNESKEKLSMNNISVNMKDLVKNAMTNNVSNQNPNTYMQRDSILNQKYSRKINKPSIRNNQLNSIKQKESKKQVYNNSMYLSDQLKNFKRNSGGSKDVTIKHEQITKIDISIFSYICVKICDRRMSPVACTYSWQDMSK